MSEQKITLREEVISLARTVTRGPQSKFSEEEQLFFLKAYLTKKLNSTELKHKYGVHLTQIRRWQTKFASETTHPGASHPGASAAIFAADANPTSSQDLPTIPPMKKKNIEPVEQPEDDELSRLKAENQRLQDQLQMAQWMVHARDVMIEEAEKTFNIAIRKKSGAKQ